MTTKALPTVPLDDHENKYELKYARAGKPTLDFLGVFHPFQRFCFISTRAGIRLLPTGVYEVYGQVDDALYWKQEDYKEFDAPHEQQEINAVKNRKKMHMSCPPPSYSTC